MTHNQIALRQAVETERSNAAREMETERSNKANEYLTFWRDYYNRLRDKSQLNINQQIANETQRHNIASEINLSGQLQEQKRSNLAKEAETRRSNVAQETEKRRSNIANESVAYRNAQTNAYNASTNRANALTNRYNALVSGIKTSATIALDSLNQSENVRSHLATESLRSQELSLNERQLSISQQQANAATANAATASRNAVENERSNLANERIRSIGNVVSLVTGVARALR